MNGSMIRQPRRMRWGALGDSAGTLAEIQPSRCKLSNPLRRHTERAIKPLPPLEAVPVSLPTKASYAERVLAKIGLTRNQVSRLAGGVA